jgi:DNA polymerase III alpha subunit (gram-positive type)
VPLPTFAVVDLETSGLSSRRHRVLQIGVVTVHADGTVVDAWSTMVKLRWPLQRVGPTEIHGITRRTLKGAPALDDALDQLAERLDGSIFTAHNAAFDAAFIERAGRRRPVDDPLRRRLDPLLCTLQMSRRLDPMREQSHRLADVCERYGVLLERPHDALGDARATAAVLPHLLDAHGITTVDQLQPFYVRV